MKAGEFRDAATHGFVRVAVCVPELKVAEPGFNAEKTVELAREVVAQGAGVVLFPELGLSGYSCDDLFHQDALLDGVLEGLETVMRASAENGAVLVVGAPLRFEGKLFNCGVVVHGGKVLGVVPKSFLPTYREFYEKRQFCAGRQATSGEVTLLGERVAFGSDLVFEAENVEGMAIGVEICEDVWSPLPPSTFQSLAGATVLLNLSASNITVGKADYRKTLCAAHSGKCVAAYLYSAAGTGESTTDVAWDGQAMIYENAELLAEAERFPAGAASILADVDVGKLLQERMRLTSFNDAVADWGERVRGMRRVRFFFRQAGLTDGLKHPVERLPFVPGDEALRDERSYEAYQIQVHGLKKRLESSGIGKVVIGVSGGLDSTQALIVACRTMDLLGRPRTDVMAYTMPGFATGDETLANAWRLMRSLGVTASELDIRPSCKQMMED
ncbi:MAG: NAD(+) synthase, partial [Verrucomicrobiales bacterium]|nr:NAD(+) synthase [Verrucomicrobiales bacterium]